jgi:hypothetical protein
VNDGSGERDDEGRFEAISRAHPVEQSTSRANDPMPLCATRRALHLFDRPHNHGLRIGAA